MKLFGASVWNTGQSEIRAIDAVMGGFTKLRDVTTTAFTVGARASTNTQEWAGAVSYPLSPEFIQTFAMSGLPFLTFYEFNDLTGWYRDTYFAPEHVDGYEDDIGKRYTVWTHDAKSAYRRHIFLDDMSRDIRISFEVPVLDAQSWFPLRIRLYDTNGLYFQHDQKLVVERITEGRSTLTSWKKIPNLHAALQRLHDRTQHLG